MLPSFIISVNDIYLYIYIFIWWWRTVQKVLTTLSLNVNFYDENDMFSYEDLCVRSIYQGQVIISHSICVIWLHVPALIHASGTQVHVQGWFYKVTPSLIGWAQTRISSNISSYGLDSLYFKPLQRRTCSGSSVPRATARGLLPRVVHWLMTGDRTTLGTKLRSMCRGVDVTASGTRVYSATQQDFM